MSELLGSLTDYFVIENPSSVQTRNAYLYATGFGVASFYSICSLAFNSHDALLLGMFTRIIMSCTIYKKVYSYPLMTCIGAF